MRAPQLGSLRAPESGLALRVFGLVLRLDQVPCSSRLRFSLPEIVFEELARLQGVKLGFREDIAMLDSPEAACKLKCRLCSCLIRGHSRSSGSVSGLASTVSCLCCECLDTVFGMVAQRHTLHFPTALEAPEPYTLNLSRIVVVDWGRFILASHTYTQRHH